MIDKKQFYTLFKKLLGNNRLLTKQLEGFEASFAEWDLWVAKKWTDNDLRKLAYILATDWHESAFTMQPIREKGGAAYFIKKYWDNLKVRKWLGNLSIQDAIDFCGKGKPMITGRGNYAKMGKILGYPLDKKPDLMFNLKIATEVMFEGMMSGRSFKGDFTGKQLSNFFNATTNAPIAARTIINGTDRAEDIAEIHYLFLECLTGKKPIKSGK